MQIIKIDIKQYNQEGVKIASKVLKQGGIIICPTDTSYLIGADARNESAVEKIFNLKERAHHKPIHVIVENLSMMESYGKATEQAKILARKFLPGPLTLILGKNLNPLAENLNPTGKSLGFRIPNLGLNSEIASLLDGPYTATSANKSGSQNAYSVAEVLGQFTRAEQKNIDLILDSGELERTKPSTVVDCTGTEVSVLREGPISKTQIKNSLTTRGN